jgi:hypothetical protein
VNYRRARQTRWAILFAHKMRIRIRCPRQLRLPFDHQYYLGGVW